MGKRVDAGEVLSYVVPKGKWFTRLVEGSTDTVPDRSGASYTVFSCSLVPGFDIRDFRASKYKDIVVRTRNYAKETNSVEGNG